MIIVYFVEFIVYSFFGWLWESVYCTINEKRWADRGFLLGPICPIYGSCVIVLTLIFNLAQAYFPSGIPMWMTFLVCFFGSAIAEFGTSYVLEKRFHMRWWDYSDMPFEHRRKNMSACKHSIRYCRSFDSKFSLASGCTFS